MMMPTGGPGWACCAILARASLTVHAYGQMTNHYHLLLETTDGNLSRGMHHLNGVYSQYVNRRHTLVGHLFQGRYKAILVQREHHLLELARYLVLNPVRAGMVVSPNQWDWSSYHWTAGDAAPPPWLCTDWLLSQFADTRSDAIERYAEFVRQGNASTSPLKKTEHQLILADAAFVLQVREQARACPLGEVAKAQRKQSAMSLEEYRTHFHDRDEAMARAFQCAAFTMTQIAAHFQVSCKTVSRAVRRHEAISNADSVPKALSSN